MNDLQTQLRRADRLSEIYTRLGETLWRLQELEGAVAQFYVMAALATRGMGLEAGRELEKTVEGNTFGRTVSLLSKAGKMPESLATRLPSLIRERNWLVHSSLHEERRAIYSEANFVSFVSRMESIAAEAGAVLKTLGAEAEAFVHGNGVTPGQIAALTQQVLSRWRGDDAA